MYQILRWISSVKRTPYDMTLDGDFTQPSAAKRSSSTDVTNRYIYMYI